MTQPVTTRTSLGFSDGVAVRRTHLLLECFGTTATLSHSNPSKSRAIVVQQFLEEVYEQIPDLLAVDVCIASPVLLVWTLGMWDSVCRIGKSDEVRWYSL